MAVCFGRALSSVVVVQYICLDDISRNAQVRARITTRSNQYRGLSGNPDGQLGTFGDSETYAKDFKVTVRCQLTYTMI